MNVEHSIPPLRDIPSGRLAQRKEELLAEIARDRRPHRRRLRLAVVLVVAAALLVAPAYAIVNALLPAGLPPLPAPVPTTGLVEHAPTMYQGKRVSMRTYIAPDGRFCFVIAEASSCVGSRGELFEQGPVAVSGPGSIGVVDGGRSWKRMLMGGFVQTRRVTRLELVMTDCSQRVLPFDRDGVFVYGIPRADLHADVWPLKAVAYDVGGKAIWQQFWSLIRPNGTAGPKPAPGCRSRRAIE